MEPSGGNTEVHCHKCHVEGHLAKNCLQKESTAASMEVAKSKPDKFWNRKSPELIKSCVRGLLIVPRPFPSHISRAHVCHGKIWSVFARLRSSFLEEENSFIDNFSTVFANS